MVKKRNRDVEQLVDAPSIREDVEIASDDEMNVVNVEFEWFNFKPDIDFHGVKNLLRQLFDVDFQLFELSCLTDLVLSQPTIGSTVKVEGEKTDAYAMMTILNLHEHREKKVIQDIIKYLLEKSNSSRDLAPLATHLSDSTAQIGLVLSERLINVPAEIAPPLYTMLCDEIEAAVEDQEPYNFTHYMILTKTYQEIESTLDESDEPKIKKNKREKTTCDTFYFHAEDEVFKKYASVFGTFDYTNDRGLGMADSKRAFSDMGIKPQGAISLIERSKFEDAVKAVNGLVAFS
ncbi:Protein BCP1 [Golovinomyces cichoracearum]|uniref:Protein BCP1 n=1 Tax=Golovinomyces cichoracearum TaxID=62708 RepID=A0A420J0X8_9PEZI|nr:Protein BCP1 [Golovinomyces cichoracearum]